MAEQVDTGLHWSSTFQRLRTEAIILSLVLLVATQLELNLSKIPLIGIEFSGQSLAGDGNCVPFCILHLHSYCLGRFDIGASAHHLLPTTTRCFI